MSVKYKITYTEADGIVRRYVGQGLLLSSLFNPRFKLNIHGSASARLDSCLGTQHDNVSAQVIYSLHNRIRRIRGIEVTKPQ